MLPPGLGAVPQPRRRPGVRARGAGAPMHSSSRSGEARAFLALQAAGCTRKRQTAHHRRRHLSQPQAPPPPPPPPLALFAALRRTFLTPPPPWSPRLPPRLASRLVSAPAQLLPKLRAFCPDLVLISAGFDAHCDDFYHYLTDEGGCPLNSHARGARHAAGGSSNGTAPPPSVCPPRPLSPSFLPPSSFANTRTCTDYAWVTREVMACCPAGRVVSVLEGGYSLAPLQPDRAAAAGADRRGTSGSGAPSAPDGGLAKGARAHVMALAGL